VKAALNASDKVKALLAIGKSAHEERVATLTARIKKWKDAGKMGRKTYRAALNEFE
jgi:hypothetical protein